MSEQAQLINEADENKTILKFPLVALLFFLSGAASLIYQVIWTRQMVFVFGSGTFATATVLSSFMGGLALGSFYAGKYADRVKNPFLAYGLLEGVIGIWALLAPFMFDAALPVYKFFWQSFHLQVLPFSMLRYLVVALILLVPTACMGATLPLLSRFITTSLKSVGDRVGSLYAINTLGAVAGSLAGGFYLIPNFGLYASTTAAALTNIVLAVSVYFVSKLPAFSGLGKTEPLPEANAELNAESEKSETQLSKAARYTMIAFGISGGIAMICEVAWTRALLLVIGSTTYAFTIMLSTFLLGIFIGSFICAKFADKLKDPVFWFALAELALGLASLFSIVCFNYLPYLNICANYQYHGNPERGMIVRFLLAASILVPVTLFLGATFPLAVKACTKELEKVGKSVGTLYSVNTLGAIIGSFMAGFLIIPLLGGEETLIVCAVANAILGVVMIVALTDGKQVLKFASCAAAGALLIWAFMSPKVWDLQLLTASQKVRRGLRWEKPGPVPPFPEWAKSVKDTFDILFWKDGMCANVAVVKFKDGQNSLFTNGHIDASDGATDMPTQVLLPSIPLLLKPHAKDVADVGWGSGCTMGYAMLFPIKKMVCAEIEPAVIQTSEFFHRVNLAPEKDPRLRIEYNDGRNYLLATDERFDVITSEPSNPWQAGVCNLYTKEYFQVCHDALKPGGIFTMWWQSNEVSSNNLLRVFAAIKKVFKHLVVFQTFTGDIAACASDEPIKINLKAVEEALESPQLQKHLDVFGGIAVADDLPVKVLMTDESLDKLIQNVPANTDDRNHIEFDVARTYEQQNFSAENTLWFLQNAGPVWETVDWTNYTEAQKAEKMALIAERAMIRNSPLAHVWAEASYRTSKNAFALCVMALLEAQKKGNFDDALRYADTAVRDYPEEVRGLCVRGIVALLGGAPLKARADFENALKLDPNNRIYKFRLAQTYMPEYSDWYAIAVIPIKDSGKADSNPQKVLELIQPSLSDSNFLMSNPAALGMVAAAYLKLNKPNEALQAMQGFLKLKADNVQGLKLMAEICKAVHDERGADYYTQKLAEASRAAAIRLAQNATILMKTKKENLALASLKRAVSYSPGSPETRIVLRQLALTNSDAEAYMKELSNFSLEDMQAYRQVQAAKNK